jgi:WD40 repeat protein
MVLHNSKAVRVFYSYSNADEALRKQLDKHLATLKQQEIIDDWHNRQVLAGTDWLEEVNTHINTAQIILLLISPDFIASSYTYGIEMKIALQRHASLEARVIPIILRPVDWENTPFAHLSVLPKGAKPVTKWLPRDDAFLDIVRSIRVVIEELQASSSDKVRNLKKESLNVNSSANSLNLVQGTHIDWGEAPDIDQFFGRHEEINELKRYIVNDNCKVVAVLGIGGIGKTTLVVTAVGQVMEEFDYIFWRSLQNAPLIENILEMCILFLSNQQQAQLPKDLDDQIAVLFKYLKNHRCLLVLDNVETVLQSGQHVSQYQSKYEGYGKLIRHVAEIQHKSCLLLTSREKLNEISLLEGKISSTRSLQLLGLGIPEGKKLLKDKGLFAQAKTWTRLIQLYSGNPLALKLISQPIKEVFQGDVAEFLKAGTPLVGNVYDLLYQQFRRLTSLEQDIIYWLAIERDPVSLDELQDNLMLQVPKKDILNGLASLRRRAMIEINNVTRFALQPVIMEFVTDHLVTSIYAEIETEVVKLLTSHALIKAQTKDYVRDSQTRIILKPLADQLSINFGKVDTERKLQKILKQIRKNHKSKTSYAAGNILNLLIYLQIEVRGYDFSHLTIRQAYLQNANLPKVNFSYSAIEKSVFKDTFGRIISIELSPNGEILAAGNANGEVYLLDITSGIPISTFRGHTDWIHSVTFSPDGRLLASGSDDQTIRLWDIYTGQCLRIFPSNSNRIQSVVFHPNGHTLASGGDDRIIRFWEMSGGQGLQQLEGHSNRVRSIAFSPDGHVLASGSDDQSLRLWNVDTGQCFQILTGHSDRVACLAFNPDGSTIASSSEDHTVRLWKMSTGQCLRLFKGHSNKIRSIAFSPDGSMLASGSDDQTIRLWDIYTGQCLKTLQGHTDKVRSVVFISNGSMLASGSEDQTLRLWDANSGLCLRVLQGHSDWVWSIAFSPNGSTLASGYDDRFIRLWDTGSGKCLKLFQGHGPWMCSIAFSPNGQMIASGTDDRTVCLWDISSGRLLQALQGHTNWIRTVAFSPNGQIIASGSDDRTVRLWDVDSGRCLKVLDGQRSRVWSVSFSPNESLLASGSEDRTIRLWDLVREQYVRAFEGHTDWVWSVIFSPDGSLLASGGDDKTVRLWRISNGECLAVFRGHGSRVRTVAFSPNGQILASGCDDQSIRLWDIESGQCISVLNNSTRIYSIAFSPDGHIIASGGYDGAIKFWSVKDGTCIKVLRRERPYESMNITGIAGLTNTQKSAIKLLGAVEE